MAMLNNQRVPSGTSNPFGSIWSMIAPAEWYPGTYPIRPIPKVLEWAYRPIPRISHCWLCVFRLQLGWILEWYFSGWPKNKARQGEKNHSPRIIMFILCGIPESYRGNSMEHDSQIKVFVYLQGIWAWLRLTMFAWWFHIYIYIID